MPEPTSENSNAWWLAPERDKRDMKGEAVARSLARVATNIETANIAQRWRSLVYWRHMTGRPASSQFAYGMARRPSATWNHYGGYSFSPPTYNLMATCADIYVNRLLVHKIFVSFIPERGNSSQRQKSKDIEMWVEGGFEECGFWDAFKKMGLDALYYGRGWLKWCTSLAKKVSVASVHPDELLWVNPDDTAQNTVIQRVWASREDLLDRYGKGKSEEAQRARGAILNAPSAFAAFWFGRGTLDCSDVVPLLEGWRLPHVDGRPGRRVLALPNYVFDDEPYTDPELPFVGWDFRAIAGSLQGQGLAEVLLRLDERIDRLLEAIESADCRSGFAKWLVEENSNVNDQALGDIDAAVVKFVQTPPVLVTPEPIGDYAERHLDKYIALGMQRAHISVNAIQGETPKALTSAVALEKYAQIEDSNFAEQTGRLEDVVLKSAYHMVRLGKQLKPSFTMPGRSRQIIDWKGLEIEGLTPKMLRAFSTGRLGQTVAGREQLLDTKLANGAISRRVHTKYSQVADIDGMQDLLNSPVESVDRALERMMSTGVYEPPLPFMDVEYAISQTEATYLLEQDEGTPDDSLDLLLMFRAALMELREPEEPAPPPVMPGGAPAAPAFGDTQTANPALAAPPLQIAPPMGAPTAPQ